VRQPVPFGKYLLLDRISVGGMAEVFKAKSYGVEGFEKIIAIKRILPTMGEDRDFIKMFIDEAKIAGQLAHANICQIFELGRIDGSHFIAMEYIWGKDLLQIQNRLRKIKQPMPIAMACFTIAKVLEGLDYAHRKRDPLGRPLEIVHRDCSPQNVLVSYEGEVKVIDFGIAKATSRNSRTMAGVLKGKFGYMSPEQVRGLPLDRRSDIFALGTMLYECLTGDRLFQGETDFSTLEKVRNVDIRPPREVNPNIPHAVEAVILKALAKDTEERYQWCSEMLVDLQAFLMAQDVVFTAKSLSSWLKEVFSTEIDRERQQLEHYKRVGRDGLISGVPAADHKGDVIEGLGEAAPLEGDPTVLGGPNFDDVEQAPAPAEVGPAPGSPAAIGAATDHPSDDDDGEAFGEEAPTEIFGEINHGANPALPAPRAPTASQAPLTRPPKPPPSNRPPTFRGDTASPAAMPVMSPAPGAAATPVAPRAGPGAPTFIPLGPTAAPQPGMSAQGYGAPGSAAPYQPYGQPPPGYPQPSTMAQQPGFAQAGAPHGLGAPGAPPAGFNGMPPPNPSAAGPGRTLLGTNPPANAPGYGHATPPQYAPYPGPAMPQNMPQGGAMMQPTHASPMQGYPAAQGQSGPWSPNPYDSNPYGSPPSGAYGQHPYNPGAPPIEQHAPSDSRRRSSIARDVAIGVAIAAFVLGGFLVVKFLLLDGDGAVAELGAPASSIATIRLAMTPGVSADLFVDDKKVATVSDKQEIPVSAGQRKVKLVGPTGARCEQPMNLAAGKTTTLECAMTAGPASAAPPGAGSASPGAESTAAPGSGSGSSATGAGGAAPPGDRVVPDKTDKMPAEEPTRPSKADKQADRSSGPSPPAGGAADKSQGHASAKPVDKPVDRPARPSDVDDDLGRLQGGTKPGDRRPAEPKKPIDKAGDDAASRGYLAVTSKLPARIAVDGVDTGLTTPITGHMLPLAPGKHKVTFVMGNDRRVTFPVLIKAGENTALHEDP
jgi:serine/threonine protein kinase